MANRLSWLIEEIGYRMKRRLIALLTLNYRWALLPLNYKRAGKPKKMRRVRGGCNYKGHETCIIFPSLDLSFDIGQCHSRAISQNSLFYLPCPHGSHWRIAHVCCYQRPVPHENHYVEQLFEIHRRMDHSELRHTLVGLDVGN
ncbi:hypothetical protein CUMW_177010, partial [Citrus unshiu]